MPTYYQNKNFNFGSQKQKTDKVLQDIDQLCDKMLNLIERTTTAIDNCSQKNIETLNKLQELQEK